MKNLFLIILFFSICACSNNKESNASKTTELISNEQIIDTEAITWGDLIILNDKALDLKAQFGKILLIKAINQLCCDSVEKCKIDYLIYDDLIRSEIEKKSILLDSLLFDIQDNSALVKNVWNWAESYTITYAITNLRKTITFAEIMYEMPETKHLVLSLLQNEKNQYWGSLSSSQNCELFYLFSDYVVSLNEEKRINLYKKLFSKVEVEMKKAQ